MFQVEYAIEAINNAAIAVGLLCKDGVVLAAQKKSHSKLLATPKSSDKIYTIDSHIACAVAGLTADANILIESARVSAQRHRFRYQEPIPLEQLIKGLCKQKQVYTQWGGLRPFGVAFLFVGWDEHYGFQLYHSDPSGNFGGWKATAIGEHNQTAKDKLKTDYKEDMTVNDGLKLAVKVLCKSMDMSSPSADKMEFFSLTRNEQSGKISMVHVAPAQAEALVKVASEEMAAAKAAEANK